MDKANSSNVSPARILRWRGVQALSGHPKSSLYALMDRGLWVRPVQIGPRSVGWPESEVARLNEARIRGASEDEIRALVRQLESARKGRRS